MREITPEGAPTDAVSATVPVGRLTKGPIGRQLAGLALPMVGGLFATMAFGAADAYFVSRLGRDPLAAMSFTFPVSMVFISLSIGLGAGTSSVVARAAGRAGGEDDVRRLATDGLVLTCILVAFAVVAGFLTIDPLFTWLGAGPETLPLIRDYMEIWYLGVGFLLVPLVGNSVLRAVGNSSTPGILMVFSSGINIVLDPLLIFGLLGLPRLEMRGAALATVLARGVMLVGGLIVLQRMRLLDFGGLSVARLQRSCREILHVGLPAAGTNMIIPVAQALATPILAAHGAAAVAGYGAATRVEALALIAYYALSSVIGPFVGQNQGAGRWDRVVRSLRATTVFSLVLGVVLAAILALTREQIAGLFADDAETLRAATLYLLVVPWSYGLYGALMSVNATFNGLGRPLGAIGLSMLRMVVLYLPLAWLGSRAFGAVGVFGAIAVSNALTGLVSIASLRRLVWSASAGQLSAPESPDTR